MPDPNPAPAPLTGATPTPAAVPPVTPPVTGDPAPAEPVSPTLPLNTVLDEPEPPKAWGEDWRQQYAGSDEKLLKRLERYETPKAALDALIEAQRKISAGDFTKPLAADATPEQITAWREANGVPEKPEAYFDNLPEGVVLGAEDKELFVDFAGKMHELNVPPKTMHAVVEWYNQFRDDQIAHYAQINQDSRTALEKDLKDVWGAEMTPNLNRVKALISKHGEPFKEAMLTARLPDGTPLVHRPEIMKWLGDLAKGENPSATAIPGSAANSGRSIADEKAKIEKMMRDEPKKYYADEAIQARYRQLIDAELKLAKAG